MSLRMVRDDEWLFVTELKDLPEGGMRMFSPMGVGMLLLRTGEDIVAMSNRCPHLGCTLAQGTLLNGIITCPCHDWSFDIRTGCNTLVPEVKVKVYLSKVSEGKVFVRLR